MLSNLIYDKSIMDDKVYDNVKVLKIYQLVTIVFKNDPPNPINTICTASLLIITCGYTEACIFDITVTKLFSTMGPHDL